MPQNRSGLLVITSGPGTTPGSSWRRPSARSPASGGMPRVSSGMNAGRAPASSVDSRPRHALDRRPRPKRSDGLEPASSPPHSTRTARAPRRRREGRPARAQAVPRRMGSTMSMSALEGSRRPIVPSRRRASGLRDRRISAKPNMPMATRRNRCRWRARPSRTSSALRRFRDRSRSWTAVHRAGSWRRPSASRARARRRRPSPDHQREILDGTEEQRHLGQRHAQRRHHHGGDGSGHKGDDRRRTERHAGRPWRAIWCHPAW